MDPAMVGDQSRNCAKGLAHGFWFWTAIVYRCPGTNGQVHGFPRRLYEWRC